MKKLSLILLTLFLVTFVVGLLIGVAGALGAYTFGSPLDITMFKVWLGLMITSSVLVILGMLADIWS